MSAQREAVVARQPILEAHGILKRFGHVRALRGTDFAVASGEIVALVGDNGAGKSTLVKTLAGVYQPDGGSINFEGREVAIESPTAARRLGIEVVYQDLALAPELDPAGNLFLGRELLLPGLLGRLGFIDQKAMHRRSDEIFHDLSVKIPDTKAPVAFMSGGQRQGVAVSRAVAWASKVLFLDEPTAALGVVQTGNVLELIRRVRDRGIAVVFVSHNMPQVLEVADRIEVMRLGRRVARFVRGAVTMEDIVAAMTGALIQNEAAL